VLVVAAVGKIDPYYVNPGANQSVEYFPIVG
jgi:hypothetical protein